MRPARPDDQGGVVDCAIQFPHLTVNPEKVEQLFDLSAACGGMFVAESRGQVIGFLCSLVLEHPFTGRPYLDVVAWWVLPDYRLTWAGPGLLRAMLRFSATQPLDMVKLAAPLSSQIGTHLRKLGFTPVETTYVKGTASWL